MVIMSKRYHSSSDSSSSDEDDGNFKRKKRNNSYFEKNFGNNYYIDANKSNHNEVLDQNFKQFKTIDNNLNKQFNNRLMNEQKLLEIRLSSLPKYDDLFDVNPNNSNDCFDNNFVNNRNDLSIINDNKSSLNCSDKISTDFSDNRINDSTIERNVETGIDF